MAESIPTADRERHSDVLVVGAGVIGLACAWRCAQRGLSVRVIERHRPGSETSSVAAGMLAPTGEALWGEEDLLRLNLASAAAYPDFAAELADASARQVPYRRCGALHVALDRDEAEELRRHHELHERLGLESEWLRPRECRRLEPGLSPHAGPGVHVPSDAEIDPAALVAALVAAVGLAGVELRSGTEAHEPILNRGRLAGVRTTAGEGLLAETTVLATGPWSGEAAWLPEEARPPVRPVKGQIVRLRSVGERLCERIVAGERFYVVPREDGSVVLGATVEERAFDTSVTAGGVLELLREAYRALPDVAELELVEARAGLRPGTPDNAPLIGRGALDGLVLATGHYRNGVLLAPATADAIVAIVAGEEPSPEAARLDPARAQLSPEVTVG